jgi:hypothetical protein
VLDCLEGRTLAETRRRVAAVLALAAAGLGVAPLTGIAFAATLTQSSVTPANGTTVQDAKPTITAVYSDNLAGTSTISLTKGPTAMGCPKVVSGKNISCTPTALLTSGAYSVAIHAVAASDAKSTANNTSTFTVDVPTMTAASPAAGTTVAVLPNGVVTATYNEAVDNAHSTIVVQQVADLNGTPGAHTPLTGATDFPGQGTTMPGPLGSPANDGKTVQFTPDVQPQSSGTYRVSLDVFGVTPGGTGSPNAYNAKAESKDVFTFVLDRTPPTVPTQLSAPVISQANQTAVPFTGFGRPGNTITVNATDGSTHVTNDSTPVSVATCAQAPICPWTVTLDAHTLAETTHGTWIATAHNAVGNSPAPTQQLIKDTTPPANPTVTATLPANSTALHVAGGTTNDTDHLTVTAADTHSHTVGPVPLTRASGGGISGTAYAADLDVLDLDDGQITVTVMPFDVYGNKPTTGVTATATRSVGVLPVFGRSYFKQSSTVVATFPDVLATPEHVVRPPLEGVAVEFTNPITLNRHDTAVAGGQDVAAARPYFVDNDGQGNTLNGTAVVDSTNPRRLLVTPPPGFADGKYTLHVSAFEAGGVCDFDSGAPASQNPPPSCPSFGAFVSVPGAPTTPFDFSLITAVATKITLALSDAHVTYGQPITLTGRLVRLDNGAPLSSRPLTVTPTYDGGTAGAGLHVTTNSAGAWRLVLSQPAANAVYRVAFPGDAQLLASTASARSLVSARVRITRLAAATSSHSSPLTISGNVAPREAGRQVVIYVRRAGASHYQRLGFAQLTTRSTYAWTHAFPAGTYLVYVSFAAQNGVAAGASGSVRFSRA